MNLDDLQRHWNAFGERDPLWAILTDPSRAGGRWDPAEFFATGVAEIAAVVEEARGFGLPRSYRRGLDFGCGVGRLTQALATHVDQVTGLDVAPSMIAHAQSFNRHGDRVRYLVQQAPPFDTVASRSVDLVYTGRVLQHIAPEFSRAYIAELARVVAPGGYLSFDVPGRWLDAPALPRGAWPAAAYRAALDLAVRPDDGGLAVEVTVMNTSGVAWPAGASINVGNHWLARDGRLVVADDQRVAVPLPLGPGQRVRVTLAVPAPASAEAAVLEVDLVHEGVTWFGWLGSPTARHDRVGEDAAQALPSTPADAHATPPETFEPVMEMHAVPRADVEAILDAAGVRLLRVRAEGHCGPRWEAWRYEVTAEAGR